MAKPGLPPLLPSGPICGEDVPPARPLACPECGADEHSGWREDAALHDGLGLEEEEFDYDTFVEQEFGAPKRKTARQLFFWWIIAILVVLGLISARFFF